MFEVLPESRGRRFYVKATGKLTDADYKAFTPLLDDAVARNGPLRLLVDMSEFEGWELRAAWDDLVLGVRHWNDFERVALIGSARWEEVSVRIMDRLNPGRFRFFEPDKRAEAKTWIEDAK